jgi:hypothetical protein
MEDSVSKVLLDVASVSRVEDRQLRFPFTELDRRLSYLEGSLASLQGRVERLERAA